MNSDWTDWAVVERYRRIVFGRAHPVVQKYARVIYLPLHGYGAPKVRTLGCFTSLIGLGMALWPLMFGQFDTGPT